MWFRTIRNARPSSPARRSLSPRLRLEALEDRTVPSTYFVTSTLDDGSANTLRSKLLESFQAQDPNPVIKLHNSLAASTITLNPSLGFYLEPRHVGQLVIEGPSGGATIDGKGGGGFLLISHGFSSNRDYTFSNLNFVDCSDSAIWVYDHFFSVHLNSCNFSDNHNTPGPTIGGALRMSAGNATLDSCNFSGNSSRYGGAIAVTANSLATLNNCTLTGNSADYGGAIAVLNGSLTMNGCTVSGNTAYVSGAGVYVDPSVVTINSCTITGNSAPEGADLYNLDSTVTLTQSQVGAIVNFGGLTLIASTVGSLAGSGTVLDPVAEIDDLIAQVAALNLSDGQRNALTSTLQAARQSLTTANTTAAANQLEAFINQVNALVNSHRLGEVTGDALVDDVEDLIDTII